MIKLYFVYFLYSHQILPKVQYRPSLKHANCPSVFQLSWDCLIGKGPTYGNRFTDSTYLIKIYLAFTSVLFVTWKVSPVSHLSPCRSSSIMPSLKRNQFSDFAISDSSSNGCGWLLNCLPSRGIHVLVSSIFLRTNNDISISDVGGKFLLQSFMRLTDILPI